MNAALHVVTSIPWWSIPVFFVAIYALILFGGRR